MMHDRDLVVLVGEKIFTDEELERHIRNISEILSKAESMDNFCIANEIIDLNRYKLINRPFRIKQIVSEKLKPFVFICNKN
ncbi:MAG: hypothetical protein QM610_03665 [Chitinophagaceae bacterium]